MLLGGAIITLAIPTSLDEVKSTHPNNYNQLTAENWDYLVDQVKTGANQLINIINQITNLSGKVELLSGKMTNMWIKSGDTVYYTSGNVGIGITIPNDKLHVNGNIITNGVIKVGTTTAICNSNIAGTLKYNDGCMSYCNGTQWKEIDCTPAIKTGSCT
jgi:hypothetical protein